MARTIEDLKKAEPQHFGTDKSMVKAVAIDTDEALLLAKSGANTNGYSVYNGVYNQIYFELSGKGFLWRKEDNRGLTTQELDADAISKLSRVAHT